MSHLRMQQPAQRLPVYIRSAADSRSYSDVQKCLKPARRTPGHFAQRRSADVGVEPNVNAERSAQRAHQIEIAPRELRRAENVPVGLRCSAQIERAKRGNARALERVPREKRDDFANGGFGIERWEFRTRFDAVQAGADRTHGLGAA